jgi:hypothetical protein
MDPAGARELAKRIAEEEQRRSNAAGQLEASASDGRDGGADTHVLFIWHSSGYQLLSRDGAVPEAGSEISLSDQDGGRYLVSKVGPSPLPGDRRRCAFLEPID